MEEEIQQKPDLQHLAHLPHDEQMLEFCKHLPKCELHAHLNGCVRLSTVRELAHSHHLLGLRDEDVQQLTTTGPKCLADCFKLFDAIHQLTTRHDVITRITQEVIEDFAADNCIYLELRTTPKTLPEHGITKQSYMAAVLEGLQAYQNTHSSKRIEASCGTSDVPPSSSSRSCSSRVPQGGLLVKFLLSIDRRSDAAAALETVEIAHQLQDRGVVGVDLSGNPSEGSWQTWLPALQRARAVGLKVTLHAAEVLNPAETHEMLDFAPERLCHMCMLDQQLQEKLWASNIPVELCLTSNVSTNSVPGYVDHHFKRFYAANHPVVLCTDDTGVFMTTLSREYALAAAAFQLTEKQIIDLAWRAIDYCFCTEPQKHQLRQMMMQYDTNKR